MNQYLRSVLFTCGVSMFLALTGCGLDVTEDYVVPAETVGQGKNLLAKENRYCFEDGGANCRSQKFLDTYGIEKAADGDESTRFIPQFPWDENVHTTNQPLSDVWGLDPYYSNRMIRVRLTELKNEYREIGRVVIKGDIIEARPSQNTVIRPLKANATQSETSNRNAFEQGEWKSLKKFPIHIRFVVPRIGAYSYNTSLFFVEKGATSPMMLQYNETYPMACEKLQYKPGELIDCTLGTPIKAQQMTLEIKQTRTNVNKSISEIELYEP